MTRKMILSLSALVLVMSTASAQQADPSAVSLDGMDIRVTEEMVLAAQAILASTRDGVRSGAIGTGRPIGSSG